MKKHNVEQGSEKWLHLRKGKIKGTTLKAIMGTSKARQEAFYEVIGEKLSTGTKGDYENPMDRGNRLEPEAVSMFEFETGKQTESIGMCESDDNKDIVQSPDRYIKGTKDKEALEVKCPESKNYVKLWITNKVPEEYEWQVVQYFVVNKKLEVLWFAGYNPDIPMHPIHIIKVTRETLLEEIEDAEKAQEVFLKEVNTKLAELINI